MKTKQILTMAAVLAFSASVAIAAPHEGGKRGRHGRGGHAFGQRFAEKLNLSDVQKQQIKDIRKSSFEQNKAFFQSSRETFQQFREARKAGDQARVDALRPTIEANRAQMQQIRDTERTQILTVLTPEQRAQWDALKAERQARRGKRGERNEK